jgi:tetrahydromethanopterin S-methyltransferase subunit G
MKTKSYFRGKPCFEINDDVDGVYFVKEGEFDVTRKVKLNEIEEKVYNAYNEYEQKVDQLIHDENNENGLIQGIETVTFDKKKIKKEIKSLPIPFNI